MPYQYTLEEIEGHEVNGDDMERTQLFYVLSKDWAYGGGCGGEGAGLETFPHMLDALESQLGWLCDLGERHLPDDEFQKEKERLEEVIQKIRSKKTDDGIEPSFLSVDAGNVGYYTLAAGYWEDFVPAAIDEFLDNLLYALEDSEEFEEDTDEDIENLRRELVVLEKLRKRSDKTSEDFVDAFFEACSTYEERHC